MRILLMKPKCQESAVFSSYRNSGHYLKLQRNNCGIYKRLHCSWAGETAEVIDVPGHTAWATSKAEEVAVDMLDGMLDEETSLSTLLMRHISSATSI